ncbi:MAG: hypothetical protein ABGY96_08275 [bacterium]|nr:hypothetical protein [Gammaproteobacteria bacterium]HIL95047.1 hypothetical protein [Pseudomonadales bacterium]
MNPLLRIGKFRFNLITFIVFSLPASFVILATIPFEILHLRWETIGWLANDWREKDENPLLAFVLLLPWLLAAILFMIAGGLAIQPSADELRAALDQYEEIDGKVNAKQRKRILDRGEHQRSPQASVSHQISVQSDISHPARFKI